MNTKTKISVSMSLALSLGLVGSAFAADGYDARSAKPSNLNETGSLLVYPQLTSRNGQETIINIANTGDEDVWVECTMVLHHDDPADFEKNDFAFLLTHHQKIAWKLSTGVNRPAENQDIQPEPNAKGLMHCHAIDNVTEQDEIKWNFLKGDALIFGKGQGTAYNAIPHQARHIDDDERVLNLDGYEYTAGTSRVWFEGFTSGATIRGQAGTVSGELVLAAVDIDYIKSIQPNVDVNFFCWNRNEQKKSRHRHFFQFAQFDLGTALRLTTTDMRSATFLCEATGTLTGVGDKVPLYGVLLQKVGDFSWSTNLWNDTTDDKEWVAKTQIVLPPE